MKVKKIALYKADIVKQEVYSKNEVIHIRMSCSRVHHSTVYTFLHI